MDEVTNRMDNSPRCEHHERGSIRGESPWLVAWSDVLTNVADANNIWLFTGNATTTNGYYRSDVR